MPRQERIKTVVLATRNDFRTSIVSYLNQSGFAAEKRLVTDLSEIAPLTNDPLLWNFIADLDGVPLNQAQQLLRELTDIISDARIHPLVYLNAQSVSDARTLAAEFANCVVVTKPVTRQHLVDALVKPFMARHGHLKKVHRADSQENALITETISHVKSTVSSLKKLATDSSAKKELITIGQRFNGVYGTFKFFASYPGYKELVNMAEVVDTIAVTYGDDQNTGIPMKDHVNLMLESVKAAFELLKAMRDGNRPEQKLLERCARIYTDFANRTDLKKRNSASQDEVDALLAQLGA